MASGTKSESKSNKFPANKKALSFDIYGTLMNWEMGLLDSLRPLLAQLPPSHPCAAQAQGGGRAAIDAFRAHETPLLASNPKIPYHDALVQCYNAVAAEWNVSADPQDAEALVAGLADWQPFPDTVAAMQALGKRYKLIALSNITHALFAKTAQNALKEVRFDAVYVAEEIGSYKPDRRNFRYLLEHVEKDLGVKKAELLHVAHGVKTDQVPAEELGLDHAWIRRGVDNWGEVEKMEGLLWWETLGDIAESAFGVE